METAIESQLYVKDSRNMFSSNGKNNGLLYSFDGWGRWTGTLRRNAS